MGLHLASTAMASTLAIAVASSAPTCPPLATYADRWLVIVSASKLEADAQKLANRDRLCVIPSAAFAYLTPGLFLVVAGVKPDRKSANAELKRVRAKHKAAYAKAAGRLCPSSAPVAPEDARHFEEIDARLAAHTEGNTSRNTRSWDFQADFQGPAPVWAWAEFSQDRMVRDEEYLFDSRGDLVVADLDYYTDTSDGRPDVGPRIQRRYYLAGGKCIFTSAKGDEGRACAQPCASNTSAKLAARAKLVAERARVEGKPPAENWIEALDQ